MNEFLKFPYSPSVNKRFEISDDEYSRERLIAVKSFYETMHHSFDIPMGLVLFGSLAKGKKLDSEKKDASDVDFTLYIDLDEYKRKYIANLRNNKDFLEFETRRLDEFCRDFSARKLLDSSMRKAQEGKNLVLEEKDFFEKKFQKFSPDQFLFFLAVWHEYTAFSGARNASQGFSFRGKPQYPVERMKNLLKIKDIQVWPIQLSGEFSIKSQVQVTKDALESLNLDTGDRRAKEYILDQERCGIARMFGLDIGGGMKKYRQGFIRELLLSEGAGEELWSIVNDAVRIRERDGRISEGIEKQFPQTLREAARYYGM